MVLDMVYNPPTRNPGKPWKWIIIDSLIVAGIAFVSALPTARMPTLTDLYVAVKAFVYTFLVQTALEKGIKPYYYGENHRKTSNGRGGTRN